MNAYNQRRNDNPFGRTMNRYRDDGDSYKLMVRKFSSDVENKIIEILIKDKSFTEKDANAFMRNMFSLGDKRRTEQLKKIQDCYSKGKTSKECAKKLLDDYYKITVVNKYQNTQKFQNNRELSGEGEITEVSENKYNINIYHNLASFSQFVQNQGFTKQEKNGYKYQLKPTNEGIDYSKYKKVAPSLFWNFITKVSNLGLVFKLDTTYVENIVNSLNNKTYVLYMKTPLVEDSEIKDVFRHSKLLSAIIKHIENNKHTQKSNFYIGIDNNSHIHFGLISNDKKFKIGYCKYTSSDFRKLIPHIKSDKQIDLNELSKKIVSKLYSVHNAKKVFNLHLDKYDEDINLYINIINNNFTIVIETTDNDIITRNYIQEMVNNYVKFSQYTEWELRKENKSNKTVYYFILK